MNLKIINNTRGEYRSDGRPMIRVHKNIHLNQAAALLLQVKIGDRIGVLLDQDTKSDFYICTLPKEAVTGNMVRKSGANLCFNNWQAIRMMNEHFGEGPHKFQISKAGQDDPGTGLKIHLIITAPVANDVRLASLRRPANGQPAAAVNQ